MWGEGGVKRKPVSSVGGLLKSRNRALPAPFWSPPPHFCSSSRCQWWHARKEQRLAYFCRQQPYRLLLGVGALLGQGGQPLQ